MKIKNQNKDGNQKLRYSDIPKPVRIKCETILILGLAGTIILFGYAFSKPDGHSLLGTVIPTVFRYLFVFKYLICMAPVEMAVKYFERNGIYKYIYKRMYIYKPPMAALILIWIFTRIKNLLTGGRRWSSKTIPPSI